MKYIALDIEGNIQSLGECKDFCDADEKTFSIFGTMSEGEGIQAIAGCNRIQAIWIWDEKSAMKVAETIKQKLQ